MYAKGTQLIADYNGNRREVTVVKAGKNKQLGQWLLLEIDEEREWMGPFKVSERETPQTFKTLEAR